MTRRPETQQPEDQPEIDPIYALLQAMRDAARKWSEDTGYDLAHYLVDITVYELDGEFKMALRRIDDYGHGSARWWKDVDDIR